MQNPDKGESNEWTNKKFLILVCDQEESDGSASALPDWVWPHWSCLNKNAIVVGLSKHQYINFRSFKAFLIISRVNI